MSDMAMEEKKKKTQVRCPSCGYRMPVFYEDGSESEGIYVTCKGRGCKKVFEIRIKKGKQIK